MEDADGTNEEGDLDDRVPVGVELLVLRLREREVPGSKVIVGFVAVVYSDELLLARGRADLRSTSSTAPESCQWRL